MEFSLDFDSMNELFQYIREWSNKNSGFITVLIFITTFMLGWLSGIFRTLRNRPKFIIESIPGPTFCSTFDTGGKYNEHDSHITAFAIYLLVTNIGSAASSITNISIGYRNYVGKNYFLRFWINEQIMALKDFTIPIGDDIKVYPFLLQGSALILNPVDNYLEVGKSLNGIVYFEQQESWGGFRPRVTDGHINLRIKIKDSFGSMHSKVIKIPNVNIDEARKYNSDFGKTLDRLK